jgi:hypothetical protein
MVGNTCIRLFALCVGITLLSSPIQGSSLPVSGQFPAKTASQPRFQAAMETLYQDFNLGRRDFAFENIEVGGKYLDTIPESETRLQVNGRGEATLFRRKGPGDTYEFPPGLFTGHIPDSALKGLLDNLRKGQFYDIASEFHGPGEPVDRFIIRTGKETFAFNWGFSTQVTESKPMIETNRILMDWTEHVCTKPIWSLTLKADRVVFKGGTFSARLRVANRGTKTIHILNPGSPGLESDFGLTLIYAEKVEEQEGFTSEPTDIKLARLATRPLRKPQLIPIAPGSAYTMQFLAEMDAMPKGWEGKFTFNSHLATDTLLGKHVFNGTLFTEPLSW